MKLTLTDNKFIENPHYTRALRQEIETETWYNNLWAYVDKFDQNGFDLTKLEEFYAKKNAHTFSMVRPGRNALIQDWFLEENQEHSRAKGATTGPHINHAYLFERKGFGGEALIQMERFANKCNLVHKVLQMKPKWGLDFSIDYVDKRGNVFEVLHWEWDTFNYEEVIEKKKHMEDWLVTVDWNEAASKMLDRKSEWHHLGFFEQSDWKTRFFDIEKERFKMVIWK